MKTQNEFQNLGEEFIKSIREKETWKKISVNTDIPWSINLIKMYANKLDLDALFKSEFWDNLIEIDEKILMGKLFLALKAL